MERNREAAQLFRQRQKAYVDELEDKVNLLLKENIEAKTKVNALLDENKAIKDEMAQVRSFLSQTLKASFALEQLQSGNLIQNLQNLPPINNVNMEQIMSQFPAMFANSTATGGTPSNPSSDTMISSLGSLENFIVSSSNPPSDPPDSTRQ